MNHWSHGLVKNSSFCATITLCNTMTWLISQITFVFGYGLNGSGFESQQRQVIIFFSQWSRPALGPSQPPVETSSAFLSWGRDVDHSRARRLRMSGAISLLPLYALIFFTFLYFEQLLQSKIKLLTRLNGVQTVKIIIFYDVTSCRLVNKYIILKGICFPHVKCRRVCHVCLSLTCKYNQESETYIELRILQKYIRETTGQAFTVSCISTELCSNCLDTFCVQNAHH